MFTDAPPAAAEEHGRAPAAAGRDARRQEGGQQPGDVQRGGEGGEKLAVELAVVAHARVAVHPAVHVREELAEERLHGRHAACTHVCHSIN
jgi:hypothetical protein